MAELRGEDGFPILMAAAPGQVADQGTGSGASVERDTQHGNPWFDPKTGRFSTGPNMKVIAGQQLFANLLNISRRLIQQQIEAVGADSIALYQVGNSVKVVLMVAGSPITSFPVPTTETPQDEISIPQLEGEAGLQDPTGPKNRSDIPTGVDELEWERRLDAVRDLARTSRTLEPDDIRQWLEDRANDISSIDIDQFIRDVRAHRLDDIADAININQLPALDKRNSVRVSAPKKWLNDTMAGLEDHEILKLANRLQARGWSDDDLRSKVLGKIKDEGRRADLEQKLGEPVDIPQPEPVQLEDLIPADAGGLLMDDEMKEKFYAFMDSFKMPEPIINLEVPVTAVIENRPKKKTVVRDEKGMIQDIIEEEAP